jgi:hypothetical protein
MTALRAVVWTAAVLVFGICLYVFLRGTFHEGGFKEDLLCWYFLAKGIFCSVSLIVSLQVVEALTRLSRRFEGPPLQEETWEEKNARSRSADGGPFQRREAP